MPRPARRSARGNADDFAYFAVEVAEVVPPTEAEVNALLDDLERNFAAQRAAMLRDDKTDLDIEIGVLRDRLAREGLAQADTAPTAGPGSQ